MAIYEVHDWRSVIYNTSDKFQRIKCIPLEIMTLNARVPMKSKQQHAIQMVEDKR